MAPRDQAYAIVHDPFDMPSPGVAMVTLPRDALVDRIEAALAAERERCAQIADRVPEPTPGYSDTGTLWRKVSARQIAAAIRRG